MLSISCLLSVCGTDGLISLINEVCLCQVVGRVGTAKGVALDLGYCSAGSGGGGDERRAPASLTNRVVAGAGGMVG